MVYFCKSAECVSHTAKAETIVFRILFFYLNGQIRHTYWHIEQHSMSTCRQNKHTQRHLVEAENAI